MAATQGLEQLDRLLDEARRNEATWKRLQDLELELMASESLQELLCLLGSHASETLACEFSNLQLLDPGFLMQRLLQDSGHHAEADKHSDFLRFCDREHPFNQLYPDQHTPQLGTYKHQRHEAFFPGAVRPHSIALLPLIRGGIMIGSLNLGSLNRDKFNVSDATDFLQHLASVIAVCIESMASRERLKHLGLKDPLTGINNRRFFDQRLLEEVSRSLRNHSPLCALFIDVDHFKAINDQYGHKLGDIVLQQVSGTIREQLRNSDILARYGGEEFAALLPADTRTAVEIAERIRICIAQQQTPAADSDEVIQVSVSIGVATLPEAGTDQARMASDLIHHADKALYYAKEKGRNCTIIFMPDQS